MKFQWELWEEKPLHTCFPESVSKKASEETKNSKSSEEYFGREFAYKEKERVTRAFSSSNPNSDTNKWQLVIT